MNPTGQDLTENVEVPDNFAVARWPRDANIATIGRCILGALKHEPHAVDITGFRRGLEGVIEHERDNDDAHQDDN